MSERIVSVDNFIKNVSTLEWVIRKYTNQTGAPVKIMALQYIKRKVYKGFPWDLCTGTVPSSLETKIQQVYPDLADYFTGGLYFKDHRGNKIDAIHFAATLNGYNTVPKVKSWFGWASDLATLMRQVVKYFGNSHNAHNQQMIYDHAVSLLNHDNPGGHYGGSSMGVADTLADVDANNIYAEYNFLTLQECLEKYYNSNNGYGKRYSRFIDSLVTNKSREDFRGRVYKEVTGKYLGKSPFKQFAKTNYGYPSEDQVQQFTGAFTDVIFRRAKLQG